MVSGGIASSLNNDNVVILSHNEAKLKSKAKDLGVDYEYCDVTDPKCVEKAISNIVKRYKSIDVLINNAGVWLAGDIASNTDTEISNVIDVNLKGPIYMTKYVLPVFRKAGKGLIINISSQAAIDLDVFSSVYNASKVGLRGFSNTLTKAYAKENIRVVNVNPGFMKTDLFKKAGNDYDMTTALDSDRVAKVVYDIINYHSEVVIPDIGVRGIENY